MKQNNDNLDKNIHIRNERQEGNMLKRTEKDVFLRAHIWVSDNILEGPAQIFRLKLRHWSSSAHCSQPQRINFIFQGNAPARPSRRLCVCSNHFSCSHHFGQFNAGLLKKLCLKQVSVPTLRGQTSVEGNVSLLAFLKIEFFCSLARAGANTFGN